MRPKWCGRKRIPQTNRPADMPRRFPPMPEERSARQGDLLSAFAALRIGDQREISDLTKLANFAGERSSFLGRDTPRSASLFLTARLLERWIKIVCELVDDARWCPLSRKHACPNTYLIIEAGLLRSWNVGEDRETLPGEVAARAISPPGASCQPPGSLSTGNSTGSARSPCGDTARQCCPRHGDLPARSGSSPRPNNACASPVGCTGQPSQPAPSMVGFAVYLRSCERYDEPETLPYSIRPFCPMSADGGQSRALHIY